MMSRVRKAITILAAAALLGGCASSSGQPAESPTAPPVHSAQAYEPALPVVPGYTYSDLTPAMWKEMGGSPQHIVQEANSNSRQCMQEPCFVTASVHLLSGPGMEDAVFIQVGVAPQHAQRDKLMSALVASYGHIYSSLLGGTPHTEKLAGLRVIRIGITDPTGWVYIWHTADVVQIAIGADPGPFFRGTLMTV